MNNHYKEAKVYKNLENDYRFTTKLELFLYFRLWGYRDIYKPFVGNAESIKKFFNLSQPLEIIKKELNYMYKCGLIYAYKFNSLNENVKNHFNIKNIKDDYYLIGCSSIGARVGGYYYMSAKDTENNLDRKQIKSPFIINCGSHLKTNCKNCEKYGMCNDYNDCISVLMKKLYYYENKISELYAE